MTYNDGNIPYGSQVVTIGATAYVAENINFTQPTTAVERRDEIGDPSGQLIKSNFDTGSAALQLATTATQIPAVGATFTFIRTGGLGAVTIGVVVSEVGEVQAQLDISKVNINFRRRYYS